MDFESPDVEKDFPGLYASDAAKRNQSRDSDYSDEEKVSRKDLLGKRKDKKESKKDIGYMAFAGESSDDEIDETKSPGKIKKNRSTFKFPGKDKKEKHNKTKEKDAKEKKDDDKETKTTKKDLKDCKKDSKDSKKSKNKEEKKKNKNNLLKIKDKKKKSSDFSEERPIFGVPLQEAVERSKSHDGIEIPVIVRECIDYIEEHGLACEGIYRISGVKSKVRQLKNQYNRGEKVYLYEHEPHIVAILLKQFLRDLPEPILTKELMPQFEEAGAIKNDKKKVETLMKLIESLPNCNRLLLSWIFVHMLHVVKLEKRNKMNLQNVSIVLSPVLQVSHRVLNALFSHSDVLFKGVEIKKYVPPIEPDSSRLSLELPDSPTAIEDELCKQENLLNIIHEQLNTGLRDTEKEEKLWEVQRVVTQLKRKLRFLRQIQGAEKSETTQVKNKSQGEGFNTACSDIPVPEEQPEIQSNLVHNDDSAPKPENQNCDIKDQLENETDNKSETSVKETDSAVIVNDQPDCTEEDGKDHEQVTSVLNEDSVSKNEHDIKNVDEEKTVDIQNETNISAEIQNEEKVPDTKVHDESVKFLQLYYLHHEMTKLQIQEEEFFLLGDELRRKINSEKTEVERLKQEILEYQKLYKYRFSVDSTENSSSGSDDSSISDEKDDNEQMVATLEELLRINELLERKNAELSRSIQQERVKCVDLKVLIKMATKEPECTFM